MKIKINWGTGLALGMIAFISFIMFFVVQMLSDKKYDHDLVIEDYYGAELHYQQDINAEENALSLSQNVQVEREKDGWRVIFPQELQSKQLSGKVNLYRPSDKRLDFDISFDEMNSNVLVVNSEKLLPGRWNMNISWIMDGKNYLVRKELTW